MGKKLKSSEPATTTAAKATISPAKPSSNQTTTPFRAPAKPSAERSEFLKLFWSLAENDAAARAHAVAQLLAHLTQQQQKAPLANGVTMTPITTSTTSSPNEETAETDLQYTLKRLVRGLASSRDAARQGFSTALAGLLAAFPTVLLQDVQALLADAMEVHSSMKGMEQREHMFGRLFGLLALQRSGRLRADQPVAVAVVTQLLEMAAWKKWFREACFEGVLTVLADVTADVFVTELAPALARCLAGDVSAFSAEQVQLAAGVSHYVQSTPGVDSRVPTDFPARRFLRRQAIHALVEPLKASSACYPRVHAAWFGVFGHVLHTGAVDSSAVVDTELFHESWTVLVENSLLHPTHATHERRGLALKLFELVVPHLPRPLLRATLTPNLVTCLYTNAVSKKNYLYAAARHTLKAFATLAPVEYVHFFQKQFVSPMASLVALNDNDNDDSERQADAKKARVSDGGFDALIALEEAKERAEFVQKKTDNVRLWALDALVTSLAELLASDDESETTEALRAQSLRFLVFHALFVATGKATLLKKTKAKKKKTTVAVGLDATLLVAEPALSNVVLATALKRLLSLLSVKLSGEPSSVLSRVYTLAHDLLAADDAASLRDPLPDDVAVQLTTVAARVTELRQAWSAASDKEAVRTKQLEAFLLLFMSVGVQLLDAEQRSDAAVGVTDLEKCYADLLGPGDGSRKSAKKLTAKKPDEPNSVVVFTDLLMGLLSQDSSAMRDIVAHVFRSVLPLLNAESIQTMLNVLMPSADENDDNDDDENDGGDGGRVTRKDDEAEDDDDDMENDDDDDEIVLTTAEDVSKALSADPKLAELHREDMALAAIVGHVKDRANRKKNAKRATMQVLHFKLRVLDLLQVFATKCATSPLVLALVLPLFRALVAIQKTDKDARVLSERLQAVLSTKLLRAKDVPSNAELSPTQRERAAESLAATVELLTTKSLEKEQARKLGAGVVVYFLRVLCSGGDRTAQPADATVQAAVAAAVADAFTKKHSRFPPSVFDDLITRFPLVAVHVLLQPLAQIASATASAPPTKTTTAKPSGADADADSEAATGLAVVDEFSMSEVFRLLSLLLKPKLLVDDAAQQAVRSVLSSLQSALLAVVRRQHESGVGELKTKRMKPVLSFALHLVKAWKQLKAASETKQLSELLVALTALESNSPVVKSIVKQIAEASELPAAIAAAAEMTVKMPQPKPTSGDEPAKKLKEHLTTTTKTGEKKVQKAKKALEAAKKNSKSVAKKRKRASKGDSDDE